MLLLMYGVENRTIHRILEQLNLTLLVTAPPVNINSVVHHHGDVPDVV